MGHRMAAPCSSTQLLIVRQLLLLIASGASVALSRRSPGTTNGAQCGALSFTQMSANRLLWRAEYHGHMRSVPGRQLKAHTADMPSFDEPRNSSGPVLPHDSSVKDLRKKLQRVSSKDLHINQLMNLYFPELGDAAFRKSDTPEKKSEFFKLLNSVKTLEQWFLHSSKIITSEEVRREIAGENPYNLSEALKSPMIRRELIYDRASPYVDALSWDPVGMRNMEDPNDERNKEEKYKELVDALMSSIPKPHKSANLLDRSKLPADFPASTLQLYREIQFSNEKEWAERFKTNPTKVATKVQKAIFDLYKYFEDLLKAHREFFEGPSPKENPDFSPESLTDANLFPITSSLSIGNSEKLGGFDEYDTLGGLIADKTAEVGSTSKMKKMLKTTEWLKDSVIAKHDESLAGFTYADFDKQLQELPFLLNIKRGQLIEGRIVYVDARMAMVDIKAKAVATLPIKEVFLHGAQPPSEGLKALLKEGDVGYFEVLYATETEIKLTFRTLYKFYSWQKILEWKQADASFWGQITQINRGGARVSILGVDGFLPNSQIVGYEKLTEDLIGKKLLLKVLQLDLSANKLFVSHRRAEVEQKMERLQNGALISGVVTNIKPFGVIVQFGVFSGLLHNKEISSERVDDPGLLLPVGLEVKAVIHDYDKATSQVYLSTKSLERRAGEMLTNRGDVFKFAEETVQAKQRNAAAEKEQENKETDLLFKSLGLDISNFVSSKSRASPQNPLHVRETTDVKVESGVTANPLIEMLYKEAERSKR